MFIIFGYRTLVKNIGAVFKRMCDHCHNEKYWVLTQTTRWFTLFFIPIIPSSSKYFLSCPICKYGFTLKDDQVKSIKPIAETNQLLVEGKITEAEYNIRMNRLNGGSSNTTETKASNPEVLVQETEKLSYCASCGTQVTKELKFCGNCGTAITK